MEGDESRKSKRDERLEHFQAGLDDAAAGPGGEGTRAAEGERPARRGVPGCGLGRTRGSKNRLSGIVKGAIGESFDMLGRAAFLYELGRHYPEAYARLLGQVLSKDTEKSVGDSLIALLTGKSPHEDEDELEDEDQAEDEAGSSG